MQTNTLEFSIGGMHCAACSSRVERVVGQMPEVASVGVSLATDTGRVILANDVDPETASQDIVNTIQKLGFTAEPLGSFDVQAAPAGRNVALDIGGMHCAACSSRIERTVGQMPQVKNISVSLADNSGQITLADGVSHKDAVAAIVSTIEGLGYTAQEVSPQTGGDALSNAAQRWEKRSRDQQEELAARKRDLIPAFVFALPLLALSMGEMAGMPLPDFLNPRLHPFTFALVQLALCLPVMISGRRFFRQGVPALLRRAPNMDSLVALGTGAAFLFSLWNTALAALMPAPDPASLGHAAPGLLDMLFGSGHSAGGVDLYYESAAVVIALVSLGKYLESRSRVHTSEALKGLLDLTPETALRLPANAAPGQGLLAGHEEIPLARVIVGDRLLIRPGARVPVDGTVLEGHSFVDESLLTGESMPVEKQARDPLAGGSINQQGALVMRADRVGSDTVLARIVRLVQEAQGSKAPIASLADRVSYYFVPAVMAVATLAGLCWWVFGDSGAFALRVFVSVMVIACPCAMGLATPMSIMVGTGRGAQLGVLFKNGTALEQSSRITSMVFDKTGTLTEGKPSLVDIRVLGQGPANGQPGSADAPGRQDADKLLQLAASLEHASEHPLARALIRAAEAKKLAPLPVSEFTAIPGKGVFGLLHQDEDLAFHATVGNAAFAAERMAAPDPGLTAALETYARQGKTPVVLLLDERPAAIFAIADPLRSDAARSLAAIRELGISCVMLTGDNETTAKAVASDAGIDEVIAGVLPEGKEEAVAKLRETGAVVGMVGDGVNDTPALARADVGFAMKSGIDAAVETGDVVLMRPDLDTLVTALRLGRAVMRNIRENLCWAFGYNIIGIPFAAGVFHIFGGPTLSPMLAGAAMALSSVSVVTNSLRLRFFAATRKGNT
jgi:Cu+-exporting ATPase